MGALRAFGGAPLAGDNMSRFAHLDEAGTSAAEPHAIVAGIISNPDQQWKALQQYLSDMADDLIPADLRKEIIFHAKDIWHGTGKFPKERFSRERRNLILQEIAKIPKKFAVPVIVGGIEKSKSQFEKRPRELSYAIAFGLAAVGVEYFLREYCEQSEIATLIAEDVPEMRRHAKEGYDRLQEPEHWNPETAPLLPLTRIVETPHFVEKKDSSILQVADTIAFVSCRIIRGKEDVRFIFDEFRENVIVWPRWSAVQARPND